MTLICSYALCVRTESKPLFLIVLDHRLQLRPREGMTVTGGAGKEFLNTHPSFGVQRYASSRRIVSQN